MLLPFNKQKKLVFYASLGGFLEFYDFVIYALLAGFISEHFFLFTDKNLALLATFSTFAMGYFIRPIGGIVFGHLGDKYGRKKPFVLSVVIMGFSTFLMGCIPSGQSIGSSAAILLIFLRVLQGFSLGGEIPGSITYVSEISENRKGLYTALLYCGITPGILLGSLVIEILYETLNPIQMYTWGWRIPFLLGGLFGLVNYFLRTRFQELPAFTQIEKHQEIPFFTVVKSHFRSLLAAFFLMLNGSTCTILLFLFIPTYLTEFLHYSPTIVSHHVSLFLFVCIILYPIFGFLVDKFFAPKFLIIFSISTVIFSFPIFYLYTQGILLPSFVMSALLHGMSWGIIPSTLARLFPTDIRYSGIGTSYNFAYGIFGSITPAIAILLIHISNHLVTPAFILLCTGLLSFAGALLARQILMRK